MIGNRPTAVVSEVSMIARNRCVPDCNTACLIGTPFSLALFMKSTMIKLSLTTTPVSAIRPKREIMLIARPMTICPMTAPIRPNGMMDMMISGCV